MRAMRIFSAAMTAIAALGASADAEPVKIRLAWVAPISNLGSIVLEKKDHLKHIGQS
jgi:sulfonate transport system substrate-binding protein